MNISAATYALVKEVAFSSPVGSLTTDNGQLRRHSHSHRAAKCRRKEKERWRFTLLAVALTKDDFVSQCLALFADAQRKIAMLAQTVHGSP